ncbi:MAG: uroporphyrinogen-III synthase [Bacteroidota bacterium]
MCALSGWQLNAHPFIQLTPLPFVLPAKQPSWIFFSSKNGVTNFFRHYERIPGVKYGAIGQATANILKQFVWDVDFVGTGNDTSDTGHTFSTFLTLNDFVWFPGAADGKRAIQEQLGENQYLDIPVYFTEPSPGIFLDWHDVLVFTSPSNVEGFLMNNEIQAGQKVLAIGKTTAARLEARGHKAAVSAGFGQLELYQSIASILL